MIRWAAGGIALSRSAILCPTGCEVGAGYRAAALRESGKEGVELVICKAIEAESVTLNVRGGPLSEVALEVTGSAISIPADSSVRSRAWFAMGSPN